VTTRTPCPGRWRLDRVEVVQCILAAGHEHALDAHDKAETCHHGLTRAGGKITWYDS
jgi:hypothetical protein